MSDGGSPLTGYQVSNDNVLFITKAVAERSHVFSGLTNGQMYMLYVPVPGMLMVFQ